MARKDYICMLFIVSHGMAAYKQEKNWNNFLASQLINWCLYSYHVCIVTMSTSDEDVVYVVARELH